MTFLPVLLLQYIYANSYILLALENDLEEVETSWPFSVKLYNKKISRLKFAKFYEHFKNKPEAEIVKRI